MAVWPGLILSPAACHLDPSAQPPGSPDCPLNYLFHFPSFIPDFSIWRALLPPVYLSRTVPKDSARSKPFPKPNPVFCEGLMTSTQDNYLDHSLVGVKHMRPSPLLELMCWALLIFPFQELSYPFPCLYLVCPTRMQPLCWQVLHLTFMSLTALSNTISYTEWARNKYVFVGNRLILSPPIPTMRGTQQPFHTDICSYFLCVAKLPFYFSASRLLAFLKCLGRRIEPRAKYKHIPPWWLKKRGGAESHWGGVGGGETGRKYYIRNVKKPPLRNSGKTESIPNIGKEIEQR